MTERATRGAAGRPTAKDKAPSERSTRGRSGSDSANARLPRRLPAVEVDRIVLMRVALVLIVLGFLYLVVWIGERAFGSGKGQMSRIDRVIIDATGPNSPPAAPGKDAALPHAPPP